ncbi:ArsR family transcriptional regulator [Candidatus Saccharibacteria bacterium]|nr:ArsR family transcriptional regulator [Candidatus Saccharibacteria bacterium]MCB9834998.1 ArsR family transcriptional regulator [Candidatus Nomurabacteria bacterium]
MLNYFITSKTRRKLVTLFSKHPDYEMHVRGIAKTIHEDPGNVQRELIKLSEIGYLKSKDRKNTKVYTADKKFPAFRELQSLVLKLDAVSRSQRLA